MRSSHLIVIKNQRGLSNLNLSQQSVESFGPVSGFTFGNGVAANSTLLVTVRGNVINGTARIGTAFAP